MDSQTIPDGKILARIIIPRSHTKYMDVKFCSHIKEIRVGHASCG